MDFLTQRLIAFSRHVRDELRSINNLLNSIKNALQQQTEAIHEARNADDQRQQTPPILRAELQVPHPIEVETHPKDKKTGREWYKLIIETLTLLGVLAYATIAAMQWCQMKIATKATQDAAQAASDSVGIAQQSFAATVEQSHLDQRAWVGLDNPHIIGLGNNTVSLAFKFVNSGKTAAKDVKTRIDWEAPIGVTGLPPICDNLGEMHKDLSKRYIRDAPYVPPQGKFTLREPTFNPSFSEDILHSDYWHKTQRENWSGAYFCVFGEIIYRDVNDKSHFTHFCVYASKDSINDVGYCAQYNDLN